MPSFTWVGKPAVENHDRTVPYRLLQCDKAASHGDPDAANAGHLIVEGDNLEALKALLPYYRGQVKCAYIDPPYNTGNEGWVYNDNVNSPEIKRWLGTRAKQHVEEHGDLGSRKLGEKVVSADDLNRHEKWLCMIYPRLKLLREFLRDDGALFVSIDDNEVHHLRMVLDEVFGVRNFIASIVWQKKYSASNDSDGIPAMHDYVLAYQRSAAFARNLLPRTMKQDKAYKNPDNDRRGPWKPADYTCNKTRQERPGLYYSIKNDAGEEVWPNESRVWAFEPQGHADHVAEKRLWWGRSGRNAKPALKKFLSEVQGGIVPVTWWPHDDAGHTDAAKKELLREVGGEVPGYLTPKPTRLIERILQVATDPDSLVLDSFAGTGTTASAVLKMNAADGGNRRCILVEMEPKIARGVAAERVRRVIDGYGTGDKRTPGTGGGFRYCTLGDTLTDEHGLVRDTVTFADLAHHVYFKETGQPLPGRARASCPFVGEHRGTAYFLLFNGVLGDCKPDGGNVLTGRVLDGIRADCGDAWDAAEGRVIYGEASRLGESRLRAEGVAFRQIPYDLNREG